MKTLFIGVLLASFVSWLCSNQLVVVFFVCFAGACAPTFYGIALAEANRPGR